MNEIDTALERNKEIENWKNQGIDYWVARIYQKTILFFAIATLFCYFTNRKQSVYV